MTSEMESMKYCESCERWRAVGVPGEKVAGFLGRYSVIVLIVHVKGDGERGVLYWPTRLNIACQRGLERVRQLIHGRRCVVA